MLLLKLLFGRSVEFAANASASVSALSSGVLANESSWRQRDAVGALLRLETSLLNRVHRARESDVLEIASHSATKCLVFAVRIASRRRRCARRYRDGKKTKHFW